MTSSSTPSASPSPAGSATGPRLEMTPEARSAARRDLGPDESLRIAFAGGCGAMGFRLSASRRALDGDTELRVDGVPVLLDRQAARELDGATLDWDELEGFRVDHPAWGLSC